MYILVDRSAMFCIVRASHMTNRVVLAPVLDLDHLYTQIFEDEPTLNNLTMPKISRSASVGFSCAGLCWRGSPTQVPVRTYIRRVGNNFYGETEALV